MRFRREYAARRDQQLQATAFADALDDLGNPDWVTREAASRYLHAKGRAAIPTLRRGMASDCLERRSRSRAILRRVLRTVHPELERIDSLMGVAERMIRRGEGWRTDQLLARVDEMIQALEKKTGDDGARTVVALRRRERALRKEMLESMQENRGRLLPDSFEHLTPSEEETVRGPAVFR